MTTHFYKDSIFVSLLCISCINSLGTMLTHIKVNSDLSKGLLSEWHYREMRTCSHACVGILLQSFVVLTDRDWLQSQTHLNSLPWFYNLPMFAFISCPFFLVFFSNAIKLFDLLWFSFILLLHTYRNVFQLSLPLSHPSIICCTFFLTSQPVNFYATVT